MLPKKFNNKGAKARRKNFQDFAALRLVVQIKKAPARAGA